LKKKEFVYTGGEVLESMTEAVNYNRYLTNIITSHVKNKHTKILDFGAGSGTYADILKKKGLDVDCMEPDSKQQKQLIRKKYRVFNKIEDIKPGSYDVIYSLNVFEHIDKDIDEFMKVSRLLKKGGTVIVYVPAFDLLFTNMDVLVEHFRRYRLRRLSSMAKKANLRIIELEYKEPIGFFAALTYRIIKGDGKLKPSQVRLYDKHIFPISKSLHPLTKRIFGKNAILIAKK